jgi:hypothetical protein
MAEDNEGLEHIMVRGTDTPAPDGGVRVGLWEQHPEHPDGEVLVAGPTPVEVARTPLVDQAISLRQIAQVSGPAVVATVRAADEPERGRSEPDHGRSEPDPRGGRPGSR